MARRTTKTDPKKGDGEKKKAKKKLTPAQKKILDTQQLSDARAKAVSKGKMTWNEARKQQRAADSTKMVSGSKVGTKSRGSSQGLASKRKYRKAEYKRDNKGNMKSY